MPTKKKTVSVRLDPKLAKRLEALAKETERSVSWHINRIVEDSISSVEQHAAAVKVGLESARKGQGQDAEEFFAQLFADLNQRKAQGARKVG